MEIAGVEFFVSFRFVGRRNGAGRMKSIEGDGRRAGFSRGIGFPECITSAKIGEVELGTLHH